jgi:NAD(P)-dependent dehydrogenase (short-subunit alcohol dehydrogenase family)
MRRLLRKPRLVGVLGRPMGDAQWDLRGRCVVVTGASSGMGAETARFLGARGARLVLQGRDKDRLAAVAADTSAAGGEAVTVELDLEDPTAAGGLIDRATSAFGAIHGLVLNASLFDPRPLAETSLDSITRQWNTNVVSHLVITQAAVGSMEPGSSIVFISSTTALAGFAGCAAYAATKGAIEALSRTLAIELAPAGIRVNTIAPGFVRTPMLQPILDATPGYEQWLFEQTPVGRIGRPEEIGATVAFLLSGLAPYINGVTLAADGGWTAR